MADYRLITQTELLEEASQDEEVSELENHTSSNESEYSDDKWSIEGDEVDTEEINSKDGKIVWNPNPIENHGRFCSANIIQNMPGITRYATSRIFDIKSSFGAIFNSSLENKIIDFTNIEGQRVYGNKWKIIDINIFQAYIGLLLLAGVYKSHGESTKSLWHKQTGRTIFRATMSIEMFEIISKVIRFDNKTTRQERRKCDKLASIRDIWEKWTDVLPKLYNPGENVTVDEQLVAFRGRCPFK